MLTILHVGAVAATSSATCADHDGRPAAVPILQRNTYFSKALEVLPPLSYLLLPLPPPSPHTIIAGGATMGVCADAVGLRTYRGSCNVSEVPVVG